MFVTPTAKIENKFESSNKQTTKETGIKSFKKRIEYRTASKVKSYSNHINNIIAVSRVVY